VQGQDETSRRHVECWHVLVDELEVHDMRL